MRTEYHRWYSHRLGLDMGIVVYGHWGPPLMGFPTSAGDEWELERQGMISALAPLVEAGRVKFFSVNSVNWAGLYDKGAHPFHRSYMQAQLDAYLREEASHPRGRSRLLHVGGEFQFEYRPLAEDARLAALNALQAFAQSVALFGRSRKAA